MKRVFLIGDSIRLGYAPFVVEKLVGKAEVFFPEENCAFAQHTLRHLHEWVKNIGLDGKSVDVVHWNNGIWDAACVLQDEPLTSLAFYEWLLKRIYERICCIFPNAKVIFALNTQNDESLFPNQELFMRYNCYIKELNNVAKMVMENLDVTVNDLYSVSEKIINMHKDATHFTKEGSSILGCVVAEVISQYI